MSPPVGKVMTDGGVRGREICVLGGVAVCVMTGLAVATIFLSAVAAAPAEVGDASITAYLSIRVPSQVTLASDGRVYFRDWPGGINQLFRREADEPMTAQGKQLTHFPDGISRRQPFKVSPDGRWVTVPVDQGGNEQNDIFLLDTTKNTLKPVLVDPEFVFNAQSWLKDSSGFIYTSTQGNGKDFFIYWYDIDRDISEQMFPGTGLWFVPDLKQDMSKIIATNYLSVSNSRVIEFGYPETTFYDFSTSNRGKQSQNIALGYLPGEREMLMISDIAINGFPQVYRVVLDEARGDFGEFTPAIPDESKSIVQDARISDDRKFLAVTFNDEGYSRLRLFSLPSFGPLPVPDIEAGVISIREIIDGTLVYSLSNTRSPGFTYAYDIPNSSNDPAPAPRQLSTRMDVESIEFESARLPKLVSFPSFDRLSIPAFLYLPNAYTKGTTIPFVVSFHGGPEGQARPSFNATIAYLVSQGYGVLVPNVRGSTGYGKAYHELDNYKKRWDSVRDGAAAARWLVKQGYAKAGKIASYGGSYGGFMSLASVIEGADVYGACIDIVGISNFHTFLTNTKKYRQMLRQQEYGPMTDIDFFKKVSPLDRVDEIKVPVLIAHGYNDPRVPFTEALQLATELQKRGFNPEQVYFIDEGHGFAKLENRVIFGDRMVHFLNRTIGSESDN